MNGTVIQVGTSGGRGFFIEAKEQRYVLTAAHCLDKLPPAHSMSYTQERTYANYLGLIGGPRDVWAQCLFVDPIADIAVLGEPDGQELFDESEAYCELAQQAVPFAIGKLRFRYKQFRLPDGTKAVGNRRASSNAYLFSLDGDWFACRISSYGISLCATETAQSIEGGMSGSPIILKDGSAVGLISTDGKSPMLSSTLPAWLALAAKRKSS